MQDREFEKNVQQKMQDLRFAPGADVWARVQADLHRKKRRRPIVLWFLLAGLLAGGASLWYLGTGTGNKAQEAQEIKIREIEKEHKENNVQDSNPPGERMQEDNSQEQKDQGENEQGNNIKQDKEQVNKEQGSKVQEDKEQEIQRNKAKVTRDMATSFEQPVNTIDKPAQLAVKKPAAQPTQPGAHDHAREPMINVSDKEQRHASNDPSAPVDEIVELKQANIRLGQEDKDGILVQVSNPVVTAPLQTPASEKPFPKPSRLQWGVSAGAGISDLGNELLRVGTVADLASGTPGMTPTTVPRPSTINAGAAFQAGAFVARPIGRKLKLKIGANYEYFSNTIHVGEYVNSARFVNQGQAGLNIVQDYYTAGSRNNYKNSYHFVSVPVSLQWRINNHPKRGLVWENGISYSRLVYTNALHFDGISGTYYEDNSMFKKNQWSLSSALLFSLKARNKTFFVGPHVQYGLSSLVQDAGSNKHLRYGGIKLAAGF